MSHAVVRLINITASCIIINKINALESNKLGINGAITITFKISHILITWSLHTTCLGNYASRMYNLCLVLRI